MLELKEILVFIVVFFANIMEAITGFAGTMLAMPPTMQLIGIQDAKVILNILAIIVASTIAIKNHHDIDRKEFVKISSIILVGMAVGLYLSKIVPVDSLSIIYGILIIIVAFKGLFIKKTFKTSPFILVVVLVVAGIIHGVFLSGGALLVIYAVNVLKDKGKIRATLAPVWIILNLIILAQDVAVANFTTYNLTLTLMCIVPLIMALFIGFKLHDKMNQNVFVKVTYVLLIISGITLLI